MTIPFFFKLEKSKTNYHGTNKKGEPWNRETVRGPKFSLVKLERKSPGISKRLIFYFPSGAWWNLDFYTKRKEPQ